MTQGLRQARQAEGICSRETIVKPEKGERKPDEFDAEMPGLLRDF